MTAIVVADIGGTNARFATVHRLNGSEIGPCHNICNLNCADYTDFPDLLDAYLSTLSDRPRYGCLALAGPVQNGIGRLTNVDLTAEESSLARRFAFKRLTVINDFAALASSVINLSQDEKTTIQNGHQTSDGPISVMGAGTGFGAALLGRHSGKWNLTATEAGHQSFAPIDELDFEIVKVLRRKESRVSVEWLMSGPGLSRLHSALVQIHGEHCDSLPPEEIGLRAIAGSDNRCVNALTTFFSILGGVAGDMALAHGATGGVYLGGGVLTKNASFLPRSNFLARFSAKGPMSHYTDNIPIHLIRSEQAALTGAAYWFASMQP